MKKNIIFYFTITLAALELNAAPLSEFKYTKEQLEFEYTKEQIESCLNKVESFTRSYNKQFVLTNPLSILRLQQGDFRQLKGMMTEQEYDQFLDCIDNLD